MMTKELKAVIVAEVKKVLPKNWKVSFGIRNHMELVMNISKADFPLSVMKNCNEGSYAHDFGHVNISTYKMSTASNDESLNEIFNKINIALNCKNYRDGDVQRDYVDVGYYVDINVGTHKKPYEQIEA